MRWRDGDGIRWRLRQQRLAWRRWVKPGAALDLIPGGLGDDPISLIVALPGLLVFALMVPVWLVELVLRLLLAPGAAVLRLAGVIPYRLELLRQGRLEGAYAPIGRHELVRLRRELVSRTPVAP